MIIKIIGIFLLFIIAISLISISLLLYNIWDMINQRMPDHWEIEDFLQSLKTTIMNMDDGIHRLGNIISNDNQNNMYR